MHTTIFLPELQGNPKLWKKTIAPAASELERVIALGGLVTLWPDTDKRDRKGENKELLKLVDIFQASSDDWIQLASPNDLVALNLPGRWTEEHGERVLRRAWMGDSPWMVPATVDKGRLVSNGGLTYGQWVELGSPETASEASKLLCERYQGTLYQGKSYKQGDGPSFSANPIWADPLIETYPSWVTAPVECPFDQVHSGSNIGAVEGREYARDNVYLEALASVRIRAWGSLVTIGESKFTGVYLGLDAASEGDLPGGRSLLVEQVREE